MGGEGGRRVEEFLRKNCTAKPDGKKMERKKIYMYLSDFDLEKQTKEKSLLHSKPRRFNEPSLKTTNNFGTCSVIY